MELNDTQRSNIGTFLQVVGIIIIVLQVQSIIPSTLLVKGVATAYFILPIGYYLYLLLMKKWMLRQVFVTYCIDLLIAVGMGGYMIWRCFL